MMTAIKTIGTSGQISLGKEYAGRNVLVDRIGKGVWILKLGEFKPDSEKWLFQAEVQRDLDEAIIWAEKNSPKSSRLDELEKQKQRLMWMTIW